MDVLLTHGYFLGEDPKEQKIMRPYPPLGLLYISAFLEKNGIAIDVFDTTFSSVPSLESYLASHRPRVVGMYVNLMTKLNILKIISFIRQNIPGTSIVLGGPEVRYSAENFLRHGADVIVIGEGEETMLEITQCLLAGKRPSKQIKGIAFLENDTFYESAEREKLRDLDMLPVPSRHKIDLNVYLDSWKRVHGTSTVSISTMRGCPYTCKWCSRAVYGLSYRRRSPDKVVQEIKCLVETYSPDSFWFVDDVFTISHKWLNAFRDELTTTGISIRYECITRADRMNEEVILALKETGCFRVWIGAESGSQKVIDLMDRRVDVTYVRDMIRLARKHGIEAGTFIMLGYPGETEQDIEETITHLKESDPDHFTITVAYPIKGTELFQEIEITTDSNWESGTDREIDFKRTYPKKYYDYAVRRVVNEVNYNKAINSSSRVGAAKFKAKSILAKLGMTWHRRVPKSVSAFCA
jgi:anaerobic magnesium-protoporphyrin IX monomethyl ester cyclase